MAVAEAALTELAVSRAPSGATQPKVWLAPGSSVMRNCSAAEACVCGSCKVSSVGADRSAVRLSPPSKGRAVTRCGGVLGRSAGLPLTASIPWLQRIARMGLAPPGVDRNCCGGFTCQGRTLSISVKLRAVVLTLRST